MNPNPDTRGPAGAEEWGVLPRLRVLLVTSPNPHCGIREYGKQLIEATLRYASVTEFPHASPDSLFAFLNCPQPFDVVHLNHHAALHAEWQPKHIRMLQRLGLGVVVTQHDTFETWQIMQERGFQDFTCADRLVVHERVEGLDQTNVRCLRQGIPKAGERMLPEPRTLGLFGFDFPWKGFDLACEAAGEAGWQVKLICPNLTVERLEELQEKAKSGLTAWPDWRSTPEVVRILSSCWATAFLYSTGNSGTSAAIRTGIAAGRPVLAFAGCRQMRDLEKEDCGVVWLSTKAGLVATLQTFMQHGPEIGLGAGVRRFAAQDSWEVQGARYAILWHEAREARRTR